jgi:hypothetical protein
VELVVNQNSPTASGGGLGNHPGSTEEVNKPPGVWSWDTDVFAKGVNKALLRADVAKGHLRKQPGEVLDVLSPGLFIKSLLGNSVAERAVGFERTLTQGLSAIRELTPGARSASGRARLSKRGKVYRSFR